MSTKYTKWCDIRNHQIAILIFLDIPTCLMLTQKPQITLEVPPMFQKIDNIAEFTQQNDNV